LQFYLKDGKIVAKLDDSIKEKHLVVVISKNKLFPVRTGQPFFGEGFVKEKENEVLQYAITPTPYDNYLKIPLEAGKPFEWPMWGSYYRITQNEQVIGPLFDTKAVLMKQGIEEAGKYVEHGITVKNVWDRAGNKDHHSGRRVKSDSEDKIYRTVQKEGLYGYTIDLPHYYTYLAYPNSPKSLFSLRLYEDGKLLGFPNSSKESISNKGMGRYLQYLFVQYSFVCQPKLTFSTSDNTDPRTNGRTYKIVCDEFENDITLILE